MRTKTDAEILNDAIKAKETQRVLKKAQKENKDNIEILDNLKEGEKLVPIDELTESELETIKEAEEANKVNGIGDMIDFSQLYRLKGHQHVWTPISQVHKSGMCTFQQWLRPDEKKQTILATEAIRLSDYWFSTIVEDPDQEGLGILIEDKIHISKVFNNLNAHFIDVDVDGSRHIDELMAVMVPNFDENEFKPYHVKTVVKWYNEIKNKVIEAERMAQIKKAAEETKEVESA